MSRTMWEIDVPIQHRADTQRRGVHVFTGLAEDANAAMAAALRACEIAQLHTMSGQPIPTGTCRADWSARGLRPDWELQWEAAERKPIVI
ncbi:hypothetical protein GCM10017744_102860 [Streptomyces antimycoticus]|uniref:Uncharacterized protein n=1 Tax=Streptomyces antimycoticus TaxID=68175 RepID=A0A4D4KRW2_9ACTN|nr:hypothetical protein [Streptomyces antimycoticus]GDY49320.1 hypothetical protein SANT12839_102020 [Streptomyces antimycoticus]